MNSLNEIAAWLRERDGFLLQGHVSPDGDTCGCCMALALALRGMGKSAQVYIPGGMPKMYAFLKGPEVLSGDARPEYGYSVSLDVSSPERLGEHGQGLFEAARGRAVIDHHATSSVRGDLVLVEPDRGACSEIVLELVKLLGADITKGIASWLFVGISTDTGNMNYTNTNGASLRAAAECLDRGADAGELTRMLYRTRSLGRTKLLGLALCAMEIRGKAAYTCVTQDMFREAGALPEETESIVNYLQEIDGIKVAVLATEKENGEFKLSLRSSSDIDVAKAIAIPLGGGGHAEAAGCTLPGPEAEVRKTAFEYALRAVEPR